MSDPLNGKMSNIISHDRDLFARHLAASQERDRIHRCVAPIVDCIRQMRLEGCADNQISDLLRHAADELDEATMTKDGEVDPAD
jgi:hypothetical protein